MTSRMIGKSPVKADIKKETHTPGNKGGGDSKGPTPQNSAKKNEDSNAKNHPNIKRDKDTKPSRGPGGHGGGGGSHHQSQHSQGSHDDGPRMEHSDLKDRMAEKGEKKFTGRCRLFVGNVAPDTSEEEFKKTFEPYGEISEVFLNNSRGFGFIRLDYRINAEAAKAALDGVQQKGRVLRVRFATHGAALKVKNLTPFVSNELLSQAFSQFGEVERAVVIVDDRSRPTGEGIIEFARKPGAAQSLKRINEGCFLLTATLRPIVVEQLEQLDEEDGQTEKFIMKNDAYYKDREKEPRFAMPGSFEYDFAQRWKQIEMLMQEGIERVKRDAEDARLKLEAEMENAAYEYQAEQIRRDLVKQQEELRRIEEMRQEQMMRRQEIDRQRLEEQRVLREEEDRRRQEMMRRAVGGGMEAGPGGIGNRGNREDMMMTTNREQMNFRNKAGGGMREGPGGPRGRGGQGGAPPLQPPPAPPAGLGLERSGSNQMGNNMSSGGGSGSGFGGQEGMQGGGGMGGMGGGGGQSPMQRQSRFDQPPGSSGGSGSGFGPNDSFGSQGGQGMGGGPGGMGGSSSMGGGPPGPGGIFGQPGNMGGQGGMGNQQNRGGNLMDRRREGGGPRDDYGDMKRMRRY